MIFKFRVLTTEDETFLRDYELSYESTLKEFHELICDDLDLDRYEISSFFLSNEEWEKMAEFTLIDMGMDEDEDMEDDLIPLCMENVTLGRIIHTKHQRLVYVYDILNDSSLYITLMESKKAQEGESYPKITAAEGKAPKKTKSKAGMKDSSAQESAFKDIMDDFDDDFGDDFGSEFSSYDDDESYY